MVFMYVSVLCYSNFFCAGFGYIYNKALGVLYEYVKYNSIDRRNSEESFLQVEFPTEILFRILSIKYEELAH
jgi:hypothetical protein